MESFLLSALAIMVAMVWICFASSKPPKKKLPPGPIRLPVFGNWLQVGGELNHRALASLAKSYGDIFLLRMGLRNLVVVSSPELAKQVLQTQGVEFGSRPRNMVFDIFTDHGQDLVFTVYGEHWRKMRRLTTMPFFSNKVVQLYKTFWEEETELAIADLKAKPDASSAGVVIRHRIQFLLYNVFYRIMFHHRFDSEDDPVYKNLKRLNGERSRLAQSFEYNYGDFLPFMRPFLSRYLRMCRKVKEERLRFIKEHFVDERRKVSAGLTIGQKSAVDHLLDAVDSGEITDNNVLFIVENLNGAAIDTTLWPIEWILIELVNHQDVQQKVREEIESILGKEVLVCESNASKLPYFQAVIKEALRMHLPIPFLVPHMNLKEEKLGGYDIPLESRIFVNAWYLANNPSLWEKPNLFNPERFLTNENIDLSGNDLRFLPFGVGRRSCPGIILAIPILCTIIGRLIQSFKLLLPDGKSKIEMSEKVGQFSLHVANYSIIICKPLN